ncbi:MAG: hypothetical protein JSV56_01375 [Methanomassiliicoccales archaeon]|nr:MAG: hypothetical protein JSV56_01375 [Methanomassiliicoccales archaeon]
MDANEICELLPRFDCGLCKNPRCMTLARKILLQTQKPTGCQFLIQENLKKIEELLPEREVKRKHPHPNVDESIIEITPCTEDGYVTLEVQLKSKSKNQDLFGDFFDQHQLCISLSEVEMFNKMNCSSKMGYALAETEGKRIHIFKTGKIILRRADDREDALSSLAKVSKLLMPARICSCSNSLVDCFGGSCENCNEDVCTALIDALEVKEDYDEGGYTVREILREVDEKDHDKLTLNFKLLGDIMDEIRKMDRDIKNGELEDKDIYKDKIDKVIVEHKNSCTNIFLGETDVTNIIAALTQYGLARDLLRAADGLLALDTKADDELYNKATKLLFDAYSAFEKRDMKDSLALGERFQEFNSAWKKETSPWGIAKVAANGFYISRILGKPVLRLEHLK